MAAGQDVPFLAESASSLLSWETLLREYAYTNFPVREIAGWLKARIGASCRVVVLDETGGEAFQALWRMKELQGVPVAGLWAPPETQVPRIPGLARLASGDDIARSRPDCIVPIFLKCDGDLPLDLDRCLALTGADIVPSVLYNNPFAGSQLIYHAGKGGPGLAGSTQSRALRQGLMRHIHRYSLALTHAAGKTVVDCASGSGYGTHILSRVAREVVGVDLDADLIDYARRYNTAANIRYTCRDLLDVAGEVKADLLTCVETFEHVPEDRLPAFVDALHRIMAPGGTLFCTTPRASRTLRRPPNRLHVAEYSTEEFTEYLSERFDVRELLFQTHDGRLSESLPDGYPLPDSTDHAHVVQIAIATPR